MKLTKYTEKYVIQVEEESTEYWDTAYHYAYQEILKDLQNEPKR